MRARLDRHELAGDCSDLALKCTDLDMYASSTPTRNRFHPDLPVCLEGTLATLLVAVYEYCYRGSLMKARARMASAITMAMDQGLHNVESGDTTASECKRRSWSMIVS